nr:polyprotein [Agapanthus velarivirus]
MKNTKNSLTESYISDQQLPFNKDMASALSPWRNGRWRDYGLFFHIFYVSPNTEIANIFSGLLLQDNPNKLLKLIAPIFRAYYASICVTKVNKTIRRVSYVPSSRNKVLGFHFKKPTHAEKVSALRSVRQLTNAVGSLCKRVPRGFLYKYKHAALSMISAALAGTADTKVGGKSGGVGQNQMAVRRTVEKICHHHLALDVNDCVDNKVLDTTIYLIKGVQYLPLFDMRVTRYSGPVSSNNSVSAWIRFISADGEYIPTPYHFELFHPRNCFEKSITMIFQTLLSKLPAIRRRYKFYPSVKFDTDKDFSSGVCKFFATNELTSNTSSRAIIAHLTSNLSGVGGRRSDGEPTVLPKGPLTVPETVLTPLPTPSAQIVQLVYEQDGFQVKKKSLIGVTTAFLVRSPTGKYFEIKNVAGSIKLLFNYTLHEKKYYIDDDALTCDGRRFGDFNDGFCWLKCFSTQNKYIPYALKVRPYVALYLLFKCGLNKSLLLHLHFVSRGVCHFDPTAKTRTKYFEGNVLVGGKLLKSTQFNTNVVSRPLYTRRAILNGLSETISRRVCSGTVSSTFRFDPVRATGTVYVYKRIASQSVKLLNGKFFLVTHNVSKETSVKIEYRYGNEKVGGQGRTLLSQVFSTNTPANRILAHFFSSLFLADKLACDTFNSYGRRSLVLNTSLVQELSDAVRATIRRHYLDMNVTGNRVSNDVVEEPVKVRTPVKIYAKKENVISPVFSTTGVVNMDYTRLSPTVTITDISTSNNFRVFELRKHNNVVLTVPNSKDSFRHVFNFLVGEGIHHIPKFSKNSDGVYMDRHKNAYCWLKVLSDHGIKIPGYIKVRPYVPVYLISRALGHTKFLKHVKPTGDGFCHYTTSYITPRSSIHGGMYLGAQEVDAPETGYADEIDSKVDMLVDKLLSKFTPRSDNLAFTAITNEVTRKFEAWTHRPFDVDVNTCLSSRERKILGELFPEYKLNFLSKSFSSHALFTAIRTLENFHLFKLCGHQGFLDFGGNIATHITSNVSNTHLCLPNVDIKDSVRKINSKLFLNDFCRDTRNITVCANKAQDCTVHKRRGIMVEVYDMTLEDICRAMISHDCDRIDMTLLLPGELLGNFTEINIFDNACTIVREGDAVKYRYGQSGETYTHDLRNLRDIMTRVVCSVDGVLFKRTLENNRGPMVHFSICPVNSIDSGIRTFESVYSAHENNLVRMYIPKFDDRGFVNDVEIIIDKSLVMHMIEFSANCIENLNRKSFEQLMSQFRSRKGYIIYNNKVIQDNIELDQSELEGFLGVIWGCGMRIAEKTKFAARYVYNSYYAPSLIELFLNFVKRVYHRFTKCCYKNFLRVLRYIFGANSFPELLHAQSRIVSLDKVYVTTQRATICNNIVCEDFFPKYFEKYVETSQNILQGVCNKLDTMNSPPPGFEHVLLSGGGMRPSTTFCKIFTYVASTIKDHNLVAKLTTRLAIIFDGIRVGVINNCVLEKFVSLRRFFKDVNFSNAASLGWKAFKNFVFGIFEFLCNPCHFIFQSVKRLCKYVSVFLVGPGGKIIDTNEFESFLSCYSSDDEDELDDLYEDLVAAGVETKIAAEVYTGENPAFYRQYLLDGGSKRKFIQRVIQSGGGGGKSRAKSFLSRCRNIIKTLVSLTRGTTYRLLELLKFLFCKVKVLISSGYHVMVSKTSRVFFRSKQSTLEVLYDQVWTLNPLEMVRKCNPKDVFPEIKRKVKIYYLKKKLADTVAQRKSSFLISLMDKVICSGGGSSPDIFWKLINAGLSGYSCAKSFWSSLVSFFGGSSKILKKSFFTIMSSIRYIFTNLVSLYGISKSVFGRLLDGWDSVMNSISLVYSDVLSGDPIAITSAILSVTVVVTTDLLDVIIHRDLRSFLKLFSSVLTPFISSIITNIYPVIDNVLLLPAFINSRVIGSAGFCRGYLRKLGLVCCIKGVSMKYLLNFSSTRTIAIQYHASLLLSDLHNLMKNPLVKLSVVSIISIAYVFLGGGVCEGVMISLSVYRYFSSLRKIINVANISVASDVDISELKLPRDIIKTCEDVLKKKFLNDNISRDPIIRQRAIEYPDNQVSPHVTTRSEPVSSQNYDKLFFRDPEGVNNLRGYEGTEYRDPEKSELICDMRNEMCAMLRDYPFSSLLSFTSSANTVANAYNEYIFVEKSNIATNLGKLEDVVKHYHVGYNTPEKLRPLFDDANLFMYVKSGGWKCLSTKPAGTVEDPKFIFTVSKTIVEKLSPADDVAFTTREFEVGYANKKLLNLEKTTFSPEVVEAKLRAMLHDNKLIIVNKPPGSGKTTAIAKMVVAQYNAAEDFLVLSVTKAGRQELIDKVRSLYDKFPISRIKTIESVLMNGMPERIGHLVVDECFMAHCGQILSVVNSVLVNRITLFGDVNQIPYICRIPYVTTRFATVLFEQAVWEFDDSSYRCPADVCYLLSRQKDVRGNPIYPSGVKAKMNPLLRTMSVVPINGVEDIDACDDDETVYMTFTQAEKFDVSKMLKLKNVFTVNEVQGRTVKNVKLVRLRTYANDIYNNQHQFVTAISRHTETFNYYVPSNVISDKVKSEVGALSTIADFEIAAFGFRQCV